MKEYDVPITHIVEQMSESKTVRRPVIWALCDGRPGNDNQTKGVAYATGGRVSVINIGVNPAVILAKHGLFPVSTAPDDASKILLKNASPPDVIIAAGGRLSPVAQYAKRRFAPYALRAHIMVPSRVTPDIDLLIHPLHDRSEHISSYTKRLRLAGSPNDVSRILTKKGTRLRTDTRKKAGIHVHEHVMGVCIGGAVRGANAPGAAEAQLLRTYLEKAADKGYADHFIIATSRRTPPAFTQLLRNYMPGAFFIDDPEDVLYGATITDIYAASDALCVTADSVNMCSESCSTGKPVFLTRFPACMRKKHVMFTEYLLTDGYAEDMAIFTERGLPVLSPHRKRLQDADIAGDIIMNML